MTDATPEQGTGPAPAPAPRERVENAEEATSEPDATPEQGTGPAPAPAPRERVENAEEATSEPDATPDVPSSQANHAEPALAGAAAPTQAPEPATAPSPTVAAQADDEPAAPADDDETATKGKKGKVRTRKARLPRRSREAAPDDWPMRVPVPGGKTSGKRGWSIGYQYAVLGAVAVLGGGSIAVAAYAAGKTSVPDVPAEVDKAVKSYGLTKYDANSAYAFADSFLRQCLRRYEQTPQKPSSDEPKREKTIGKMSVVANDPACVSGDKTDEITVQTAAPVGSPSAVKGVDKARYVTLAVTTSDGHSGKYVVPVFFDKPNKGIGPRIIGPIGVMPPGKYGSPGGAAEPNQNYDPTLSSRWENTLIPSVMEAWVTGQNLSQYLTSDATTSAKNGLGESFENIKVTGARVVPDPDVETVTSDSDFRYKNGDEVTVMVNVSMETSSGSATGSAYRLRMRLDGDHWFLVDVKGGVIGSDGGSSVDSP